MQTSYSVVSAISLIPHGNGLNGGDTYLSYIDFSFYTVKIFYRLTLSFLLIASLTGLTTLCAFRSYGNISRAFADVMDDPTKMLEALNRLKQAGQQITSSTAEYAFLHDEGKEIGGDDLIEEQQLLLTKGHRAMEESLDRYSQLVENVAGDETTTRDNLRILGHKLVSSGDEIIELKNNGFLGDKVLQKRDEFEKDEESFMSVVDGAIIKESNEQLEAQKEVESTIASATFWTLAATLCAFGLAITFGSLTSISISRRLKTLRTAAVMIGEGDLSVIVNDHSNDEIGDLSQCFNRMVDDIRSSRSELEEINDKLRASNRELEEFAYVASHDLQEPLRKIQTFGDRLKRMYAGQLEGSGNDYLDRMGNAASRLQTLIQDLLSFSKVTTKARPFAPTPLKDIVDGVISDLEIPIDETRAVIDVADLPEIEADPLQMRQLFQNLIGNALKFRKKDTPPQVRVNFRIVGSNGDPRQCEISVKDNGIGFDERYKEKIFTVFQRLHDRTMYQGTGIGLAICRRIVERHNGSITADSQPGQGAEFKFVIPLNQRQN